MSRISWPDGKTFAFTVFDDPDGQATKEGREVYAFLRDLGFRTTKGVWPIESDQPPTENGGSCDDPEYRDWCVSLQAEGFEIGYHNATQHSATREQTRRALDRYRDIFGHHPTTMSNHYHARESIYWNEYRLTGLHRRVYDVLTRGRYRNHSFGHVEGHPYFWGDLCRDRIEYVRSFVYRDINTLRFCPLMPYHDPARPFVRQWYASSEGSDVTKYNQTLAEPNLERLAVEGGACIMYAHFGHGFVRDGRIDARFRALMTRLSQMDGWFVPVAQLLGQIRRTRGEHVLTNTQRRRLERRWLLEKVRHGTS